MPLSARTRIEAYLPDLPRVAYQDLLSAFEPEFTFTFGGCTTVRGLEGNYLSQAGMTIRDRVHVVYTDAAFDLNEKFELIGRYVDELREAANAALDEEAILITAFPVHHAA